MKSPKEDPADKKARLRERRAAELERVSATQRLAQGLTGDIRTTYGNRISLMGYRQSAIGGQRGGIYGRGALLGPGFGNGIRLLK